MQTDNEPGTASHTNQRQSARIPIKAESSAVDVILLNRTFPGRLMDVSYEGEGLCVEIDGEVDVEIGQCLRVRRGTVGTNGRVVHSSRTDNHRRIGIRVE